QREQRRGQPYARPAHEARGDLALFQVHRDDPGQGLSLAARFPTRAPELGIRRSRSRQKLERDARPPCVLQQCAEIREDLALTAPANHITYFLIAKAGG